MFKKQLNKVNIIIHLLTINNILTRLNWTYPGNKTYYLLELNCINSIWTVTWQISQMEYIIFLVAISIGCFTPAVVKGEKINLNKIVQEVNSDPKSTWKVCKANKLWKQYLNVDQLVRFICEYSNSKLLRIFIYC